MEQRTEIIQSAIKKYDLLLQILADLKTYKKARDHKKTENPERELRSLKLAIKERTDTISKLVLVDIDIILNNPKNEYPRLELLIVKVSNCRHEIQDGKDDEQSIIDALGFNH